MRFYHPSLVFAVFHSVASAAAAELQSVSFDAPVDAKWIRLVILSGHGKSGNDAVAEFERLLETKEDSRGLGIVPGFNDGAK